MISLRGFADVSFSALRGSDLLIGVGAASAAKSGAVTGGVKSAEAFYWNPAGLGNLQDIALFSSGNPDSGINDVIFTVPWRRLKLLPDHLTLSTGYITRLRFEGNSGDAVWEGFALHILDMSMLDVGDDYQGSIDSRTVEYRVGATWDFSEIPLKAGMQVCYLHWRSELDRAGSSDENYRVGINFGSIAAGLQWQMTQDLSLGCVIQNMLPWYKQKVSNKTGENVSLNGIFKIPVNYTMGVHYNSIWGDFSLDNQLMTGNYGGKSTKRMTFHLLRAGWEYPFTPQVNIRSGVIIPLKLSTSSLGYLSLPSPGFGASVGGGYQWERISVDAAVYGDPGISYVKHNASLGFMLSVSLNY